jgi:hypothetical protein
VEIRRSTDSPRFTSDRIDRRRPDTPLILRRVDNEDSDIRISRSRATEVPFHRVRVPEDSTRDPGRLVVRHIPDLQLMKDYGQGALFDT